MRVEGTDTARTIADYTSFKNELLGQQASEKAGAGKVVTGAELKNRTTVEDIRASLSANSEQLEAAVELANQAMEISRYNLQFRIHEDSGRGQGKVIDAGSQEVIREIPPEQMLELSASIKQMLDTFHKMVGVLVDEFV